MKDIIIGLILSHIVFYSIFFVTIFLRSIKFELGNYFVVIIEIILIGVIIKYFKSNINLDLGTLLIFGINQVVIIAIFLSINQEKKIKNYIKFYKKNHIIISGFQILEIYRILKKKK